MSTKEESQKLMVKGRQHQEHLNENVLSRTIEEVETHIIEDTIEQARELVTRDHQRDEHLEENKRDLPLLNQRSSNRLCS